MIISFQEPYPHRSQGQSSWKGDTFQRHSTRQRHYLNQSWLIFHWTHGNRLQWNLNLDIIFLFQHIETCCLQMFRHFIQDPIRFVYIWVFGNSIECFSGCKIEQSQKFHNAPVCPISDNTHPDRNGHISILNVVLWNMRQANFGICQKSIFLKCIWNGETIQKIMPELHRRMTRFSIKTPFECSVGQ